MTTSNLNGYILIHIEDVPLFTSNILHLLWGEPKTVGIVLALLIKYVWIQLQSAAPDFIFHNGNIRYLLHKILQVNQYIARNNGPCDWFPSSFAQHVSIFDWIIQDCFTVNKETPRYGEMTMTNIGK